MPPTPTYNVSHHRSTAATSSNPTSIGSSTSAASSAWPTMLGAVNGWLSASPVETMVARACDPSLLEPPYPVHLELAEYINTKKANTAREAVMSAVKMVNHRNPNVSVLALSLIESLVQSCGYAVHLQVATKEFLNELVRRFPERPPPFPGPVMLRILEMIHNWKEGICATSRWKEDLGNIRDMHRLLSFKGYRFRDLPRRTNNSNTDPTETLKSPEELEAEDREAQQAKLQELLRRGTPKDLAAAQELMKILAGADPDAKPDYKAQTLKELQKVEEKIILLNQMLDNIDPAQGEKFVKGDVYDQIASAITAATPKLQGWISDAEAHDPESLETFLQLNDQINAVAERYQAFMKGDYTATGNPLPSNTESTKDSLIDLIDDEPASGTTTTNQTATDDLASLFGPGTTTTTAPAAPQPHKSSAADIMGLFGQPPSSQPPPSLFQPQPQAPVQGYPFGSPSSSGGYPGQMGQIMLPGTPTPGSLPTRPVTQPAQSPAATNTAQAPANPAAQKDPFADLAGIF